MLHSNHFTLAALAGLAAITATFSSCTKTMEEPKTGTTSRISLNVQAFDITKAVGKKGQSIGMNLLLIAATQDIDIMATAYDSDGDVIIARTLEAIPMKQNRITTATGVFFNSEATTITVTTTWDTEQKVTY